MNFFQQVDPVHYFVDMIEDKRLIRKGLSKKDEPPAIAFSLKEGLSKESSEPSKEVSNKRESNVYTKIFTYDGKS